MRFGIIAVMLLTVGMMGCASKSGETASPQEKANIDRFVKEGIKEGDMAGTQPGAPQANPKVPKGQPGNQPVDAP